MADSDDASRFKALIAQAEAAVAAVKDPELKRAAFEKILDTLLTGGGRVAAKGVVVKRPTAPKVEGAKVDRHNKRSGPQAHVEELIEEQFFKTPKPISAVKAELENRGHHIPVTSLSGPMQTLCRRKRLRRQKKAMDGNKETYLYSNW